MRVSPTILAIAGGGAAGTLARAFADPAALGSGEPSLAITLLVNLVGSGLLGLCIGHGLPRLSHPWRAGITTGFLGSFTTYSALTTAWLGLAISDGPLIAFAYLVGNLILGVFAAWGGLELGRWWRVVTAPEGKS